MGSLKAKQQKKVFHLFLTLNSKAKQKNYIQLKNHSINESINKKMFTYRNMYKYII